MYCNDCGIECLCPDCEGKATPNLPDGYRVEGKCLISTCSSWPENGWRLATKRDDGFHIAGGHHSEKDTRALTAFLQGAR